MIPWHCTVYDTVALSNWLIWARTHLKLRGRDGVGRDGRVAWTGLGQRCSEYDVDSLAEIGQGGDSAAEFVMPSAIRDGRRRTRGDRRIGSGKTHYRSGHALSAGRGTSLRVRPKHDPAIDADTIAALGVLDCCRSLTSEFPK
eukprot:Polyplicarium_translucidae@DN1253_c0_g1_i1.p2